MMHYSKQLVSTATSNRNAAWNKLIRLLHEDDKFVTGIASFRLIIRGGSRDGGGRGGGEGGGMYPPHQPKRDFLS